MSRPMDILETSQEVRIGFRKPRLLTQCQGPYLRNDSTAALNSLIFRYIRNWKSLINLKASWCTKLFLPVVHA